MPQSELSIALHNRSFQMRGARFAMSRKAVLLADEPGLGKTIQSIAAVVGAKTRGSILIVAPKTAAYVTWPAELNRWLGDISPNDPVRTIGGNVDRRNRLGLLQDVITWERENSPDVQPADQLPARQWIIVSPNYLRFRWVLDKKKRFTYDAEGEKVIVPVGVALRPLLAIQWAAIIVDECQDTLAGATGNVKKLSAQRNGLGMLEVRDNGLKLALSGTPFRGKHENMWGIANWLRPLEYPDGNHGKPGTLPYWRWIRKHFEVYHDSVYDQDIIGNLVSERGMAEEARSFMIRRTKKDVLKELPDKVYGGVPLYPNKKPPPELTEGDRAKAGRRIAEWYDRYNPVAVWLPMGPAQKKQYEQMKKLALADLENGQLLANSVLAEITRLKQFANSVGRLDDKGNYVPTLPSNKFDWLLDFLSDRGISGKGPSGNRVVIFSQFTRHINLFAAELREKHKIPCYTLTGATKPEDRVTLQREFQRGTTDSGLWSPEIVLANIKAGGTAITLDAADDVVILDSTANPDDQTQAEDRCHRISRIHNVTIWNVVSRGTIDQQILRDTRKTGRSLARILNTPESAISLLES